MGAEAELHQRARVRQSGRREAARCLISLHGIARLGVPTTRRRPVQQASARQSLLNLLHSLRLDVQPCHPHFTSARRPVSPGLGVRGSRPSAPGPFEGLGVSSRGLMGWEPPRGSRRRPPGCPQAEERHRRQDRQDRFAPSYQSIILQPPVPPSGITPVNSPCKLTVPGKRPAVGKALTVATASCRRAHKQSSLRQAVRQVKRGEGGAQPPRYQNEHIITGFQLRLQAIKFIHGPDVVAIDGQNDIIPVQV